jgi:hypothetical protein
MPVCRARRPQAEARRPISIQLPRLISELRGGAAPKPGANWVRPAYSTADTMKGRGGICRPTDPEVCGRYSGSGSHELVQKR